MANMKRRINMKCSEIGAVAWTSSHQGGSLVGEQSGFSPWRRTNSTSTQELVPHLPGTFPQTIPILPRRLVVRECLPQFMLFHQGTP